MSSITADVSGSIGILDSGIGGLSVVRHIQRGMPAEDLIYFADRGHVPYGTRPAEEVQEFCSAITGFLLDRGAKAIIVACNTASAAALTYLRDTFPGVPIVGMEPAVKPAAATTQTGRIGVLATPGTFDSSRYASLMIQYAGEITVFEDPCAGLVELIEEGQVAGPGVEAILSRAAGPMLEEGIDTLVLGCTHYPFVLPAIREIFGAEIAIIDPAPAVARQARRVLEQRRLLFPEKRTGSFQVISTAGSAAAAEIVHRFLGLNVSVEDARWQASSSRLILSSTAG